MDPSWRRSIENILRARGASATEAAEIASDVAAEAVVGLDGKPSLLERAGPSAAPGPFLIRVAINRWIDRKRRESFQQPLDADGYEGHLRLYRDLDPAPGEGPEDTVVQMLRDAILRAYSACPPEDLVLVKLALARRVPQEVLADFLGWSQSKVSRQLAAVLSRLRSAILEEIRRADPWLVIEWDDVIAYCRSSSDRVAFFSA